MVCIISKVRSGEHHNKIKYKISWGTDINLGNSTLVHRCSGEC